ncbi:hypothetical protein ABR737_00495 [Streptomyces sp. Edi2]|uniref:hypothetical protein n=1 Tax=Streptomyces sp. Edi2 TaxID=3162528 RepID=UPI0033066DC8
MTDTIRVATRAHRKAGDCAISKITTVHVNCACRIASTLVGTFETLPDAEQCASDQVRGTGRSYRQCPKSTEPASCRPAQDDVEAPFHGPADWTGPRALCGYGNHMAPLRSDGKLIAHELQTGVRFNCPGSALTPRADRDQPTRQGSATVFYDGPRSFGLACLAKADDVVEINGETLEVRGCELLEHNSNLVYIKFADASPVQCTLEDWLPYARRIRRHDIRCVWCGVYVVAAVDEAVDGKPIGRLCSLCDRQASASRAVEGDSVNHTSSLPALLPRRIGRAASRSGASGMRTRSDT